MSERREVSFLSEGTRCAAWLYMPEHAERVPIIVMAHGLGGTREHRLADFAERFHAAGYACLVFDYRHFGASDGQPRQLLDINRELADWTAAVAYARTLDGIDPERVILWGTSFSGGHVIVIGARDRRVAAIISQCPFTDGPASVTSANPLSLLKATGLALRDEIGSYLGRAPVMVPLVADPGAAAMMATPDAVSGFLSVVPKGVEFRNEIAARLALRVGMYRPGRDAAKLTCPALFCLCERDSVAPAKIAERHAARAPRGEIRMYPYAHFDIYVGDPFERNVAEQIAFLARHVPAAAVEKKQASA